MVQKIEVKGFYEVTSEYVYYLSLSSLLKPFLDYFIFLSSFSTLLWGSFFSSILGFTTPPSREAYPLGLASLEVICRPKHFLQGYFNGIERKYHQGFECQLQMYPQR